MRSTIDIWEWMAQIGSDVTDKHPSYTALGYPCPLGYFAIPLTYYIWKSNSTK